MLRLMFQLLGLMAILLAPLPAAAAPPQPAAVASGAEHCSETDASASHEDQDGSQEDEAKQGFERLKKDNHAPSGALSSSFAG